MELILRSAEVSIPQAIENLEQLKAEIAPKMEHYRSLVVTEDSIKEAKKDKAALNKLREAISDQRIAVKKQCLAPYEALEKQCKELDALIVAPIAAIDTQIKSFEEKEKQAKYNELKEYFDSINDVSFLRFDDVLNPKYGNKTMSTDSLKAELAEAVKRTAEEYEEITALYSDSPLLTAIQNKYAETREKSTALAYAAVIVKQYEQEQKRKERESTQNELASPPEPESVIIPPEPPEPVSAQPDEPEQMIVGTFRVTGTKAQIISLRDFMRSQGIKFEIVKE